MAKVENCMNSDIVEYFPLEEYVDRIILLPEVLEHLQDTNNDFKKYIKKISGFDDEYIIDYWVYLLYEELKFSQKIENMDFKKINLLNETVFFDTLNISNKRIHGLHNFAMKGEADPIFDYRKVDVNVSKYNSNGEEEIFWRGARHEDVLKFMNDFIKIYKHNDISILMSNPFLKSALIHLLFLRIHPYTDGNGRTARLLHNSKFTESINQIYGTKLKISPLNLSESIYLNKPSYVKAIDSIYFDLKHDSNDAINAWFNTMLNMADEQIYASSNKLESTDKNCLKTKVESEYGYSVNKKMKVRSLKK
ncbi:MAG: Fic family protein [Bacilli bacterium]|nr:Fic family protein [Bacilli bacterium]